MQVSLKIFVLLVSLHQIHTFEDGYLRYVKDGCYVGGDALSCIKYKALKIAKTTFFGDNNSSNETYVANNMISLVPLDPETIAALRGKEKDLEETEPRSFLSEWTELAKYFVKVMQEFLKMKGLRVNLPEGARTVEEDVEDNARGKKKKLAVIVPLLTLMATMKTKMMLIPVLLSVMLIKKLLLVAAFLLPSLLSTLKACKQHHPTSHYSYFGASDTSDFNSDYNSNYAYSSGAGYGKDWASNRAYNPMKHRPTASPPYITAPGTVAYERK